MCTVLSFIPVVFSSLQVYRVSEVFWIRASVVCRSEVELKLPKKERSKLKHAFADPGSPGEGVSNVRDRLKKALAQPAGFFLLPSFYALVLRLHEEGRDFRLIFRTFGVDLPSVILEFNTFCAGGHPAFPHTPDGLRARAVQMPVDTGEWYRDSEGLHLALCCAHDGLNVVTLTWREWRQQV